MSDYKLKPIPKYGYHMPMEDFIGNCEGGGFIDDDGFGYYATENQSTDIKIYPSDVTNDEYRKDFSHVVWFNK